jgi:UDP-glucose 4-epimerase
MNVLVVGGAGYVGSHAVKRLKEAGHEPVIYDNLSRGHKVVAERLDVPLIAADVTDRPMLEAALADHRIDVVMHFAAYAWVAESATTPLTYYRNNVAGTIALLESMERCGVDKLIFSSTCAVYGDPARVPIQETANKNPVSPYGRGKLMVEQILADHLHARPAFSYAALRYFNAAGCAEDGTIGEDHRPETHLIPVLLRAALEGGGVTIHGADYPTADGTAVRDYVHVEDVAEAHVLAMLKLQPGLALELNIGSARGFSVKEIIRAVTRVTGVDLPVSIGPRRAGDAAVLIADASRTYDIIGWKPALIEPEEIISTAWNWFSRHPDCYGPDR